MARVDPEGKLPAHVLDRMWFGLTVLGLETSPFDWLRVTLPQFLFALGGRDDNGRGSVQATLKGA